MDFAPRLDILPPPQRRVWDEFGAVPREFVLYGGTAIALHLGHRQSADFDFFGNKPLDPVKLVPNVPFLAGAIVTQREPNTFSCTVDRGGLVKLSFFGLPEIPRLAPPLIAPDNGLQVASLLDLGGTKASVVQMRAEAKDYIDIDAMLTDGRIDLPTALAAGLAIYGRQFNPQSTLKALSYFEDGNLRRLTRPVKDRLANAARAVDLDSLPAITAPDRGINPDRGPSR
jgi:Nucleotidyl transferase AbiEii toxin, Type IV TA system